MKHSYIKTLTNKALFERLFPMTVPTFTFEISDFSDKSIPDPKTNEVLNCKYVRLHKIVKCNRSYNEYLDLYITDFDIFQYANGADLFTTDEVKQILSNLFMDQSNYEEDWKAHHLDLEEKAFTGLIKADYPNWNYLAKGTNTYNTAAEAHKNKIDEINKGLPKFKLPKTIPATYENE